RTRTRSRAAPRSRAPRFCASERPRQLSVRTEAHVRLAAAAPRAQAHDQPYDAADDRGEAEAAVDADADPPGLADLDAGGAHAVDALSRPRDADDRGRHAGQAERGDARAGHDREHVGPRA